MRPERALLHVLGDAGADAFDVVMVHPGALPIEHYKLLATSFPARTSLCVLDASTISGPMGPLTARGGAELAPAGEVDEIAMRLCAALDSRLAARYVLGGWSFGGVLAFAMAALLERPPEQLLLIDSIAPVGTYKTKDKELSDGALLGWFAMYLGAKRGKPLPCPPGLEAMTLDEGIAALLGAGISGGALHQATTADGLRKAFVAYVSGLQHNNDLAASFHPALSDLPVTLARAERGLLEADGPLGWDLLAPRVVSVTCPGDHYTMLRHPETTSALGAMAGRWLAPSAAA